MGDAIRRPLRGRGRLILIGGLLVLAVATFLPGVASAAPGDAGYPGPSYSGGGTDPSGSKPESKVWWNDGQWWASLWNTPTNNFHIFRLDRASQTWVDTGVVLDTRKGTRADVLWDGSHLYVASHGFSNVSTTAASGGFPARLFRYSYDTATDTYALDAGFPVSITNFKTETLVIAKDSLGILWATWVQDSKVYVSHTVVGSDDKSWVTPFVLPVTGATALNSDDISTIVSFDGNKVGIMWSNQATSEILFAGHVDGLPDNVWTREVAMSGAGSADDHINLKAASDGRVFAVTKTSLTAGTATLIPVLVRSPLTGAWTGYRYGIVADHHTRPILLLDEENAEVHVFATASETGGTIYVKTSPMNAISFPTGRGTPFIRNVVSETMNNATTTKQNVNGTTDLVVLAGHSGTAIYWHNYKVLAHGAPDTSPPTAPTGLTATASSPNKVDLAWTAATDDVGVTSYDVYRNGTLIATTGSVTKYSDTTVAPTTTYEYKLKARDFAGNASAFSEPASVTTPTPPPTLITQPLADARVDEATPGTNYGTATLLRANGGSDPDVDTYLRFTVSGVTGTVTSAKLRLYATTGTVDGPAVYTSSDTTWSETGISWSNRPGRSTTGVADKGAITANTWVEFDVASLIAGNGTYTLVLATTSTDGVDFHSRENTNKPELVVTWNGGPPDTTPPSAPTNLTASAVGPNRVDLSWTAATDDVGVTGYDLYRNGVYLTTTGAVTSYADTTLAPSTTYTYELKARDMAGNTSAFSNAATATTPAAPATATFVAAADARIEEANPGVNFGTITALKADGGTDPDIESYLRVTVTDVSRPIVSAKLRVYVTSGTANGPAVYTSSDTSWSETGITWTNRPGRATTALEDKGALGSNAWVEYDVTAAITGNGTYALVLATNSTDGITFHSRENTNKPQLVLTLG